MSGLTGGSWPESFRELLVCHDVLRSFIVKQTGLVDRHTNDALERGHHLASVIVAEPGCHVRNGEDVLDVGYVEFNPAGRRPKRLSPLKDPLEILSMRQGRIAVVESSRLMQKQIGRAHV